MKLPFVQYLVYRLLVQEDRATAMELSDLIGDYATLSHLQHTLTQGVEDGEVKVVGTHHPERGRPSRIYALRPAGKKKLARHVTTLREIFNIKKKGVKR